MAKREQKPTKPDKKKEKHKLAKLKKRMQRNEVDPICGDHLPQKDEQCNDSKARRKIGDSAEFKEANIRTKIKTEKVKKARKSKKKDLHVPPDERKLEENHREIDPAKVDEISSVDEDCSRGMKKWLISYKESRPGLKVLQQRIDEFVTAYEVQQEQERKEREAHAAEGGWTVVVHHKGRKKTTDSETGITVGSVAQAAVMDKMANKKKEVALDFYRFQRREARRNEVMMLQSKFEQDKKRIQQLRAARKFRPY
ncbi:ribosomal RNA-processing protein 7 homolog A-like isoform X2 [Phoenix dactylifera]|uniref:Ribosomal RNA-processing protein 7 homolog A-like isoform X2 n=1 Tax=Phoenix dactylifera TaxID=42345 RepID=A0A8B7BSA5_PHODC|nr:ribosomal RNA-processing protein 7 homolog A-like isoform X2 [Phoenix dactylifera]